MRCLSSNLILVSTRLRSSCSKISQGARKIIEKAQKQLLQNGVRCINNTIEASINTINNSRTRLASILTNTTDLDRCKWFNDKVREERFGKVKGRQVRNFNILIRKNYNKSNTLAQGSNTNGIGRIDSNQNQLQVNNRRVINLCKTELTEGQKYVLAKGPNFSITPKYIPNVDYITVVEALCSKLKEEDAMELRSNINSLLRKAQTPNPNLTKEERIGLAQLK